MEYKLRRTLNCTNLLLCAVVGLRVGKPRNVGWKGWHCTNLGVCVTRQSASEGEFQLGRGLLWLLTIVTQLRY
jgi:hypothetical protein